MVEFDFRFGPYFIPNKAGTNKKADYNQIRGNNGQDTDKAVRVLLFGGSANYSSLGWLGGLLCFSFGVGRILLLMSASLLQLNLIK